MLAAGSIPLVVEWLLSLRSTCLSSVGLAYFEAGSMAHTFELGLYGGGSGLAH